jgi:regulator of sirC expression with transglutaminase-like and TPR domain
MRFILLAMAIFAAALSGMAQADSLSPIRAILAQPDNRIDLARAKLTIDKMIDPGIDIAASLREIDAIVARIKASLPTDASNDEKLAALRSYLYTPSEWNDYRAYRYDLTHPLGEDIHEKLLPTYLATRKGNCVSMPFLFVVLGQRLGLDVTAALAPMHIFVKYRNDMGEWINLETTSGANPARDVWIRQQAPMSDEAIANGVYMRPLSRKETVATMALTLAEYYSKQHQHKRTIAVSNLVLQYSPKSVEAMLHIGHASAQLIQTQFISKYPRPNMIPPDRQPYFEALERDNQMMYAKAEALGWREPSQAYDANYRQRISNAKQQAATQ